MGLESYSSLTKPQEHLLAKKYCFGSLAFLSLHSLGGPIAFKAKAAQQADSSVVSSISLSVKSASLTCKPKLSNSGSQSFSLQYPASSALTIRALALRSPDGVSSGQVTALIKHKHATAEITVSHPQAVKVAAVVGKRKYGLGVEAEYDAAAGRVVTYNFLEYFKGKGCRVVLQHVSTDALHYKPGDFLLSYYTRASKTTHIAAKAMMNWERKDVSIEFGADYKHSDSVTLRGKIDSQGRLAAGMTKSFGEGVEVSVGTEVDSRRAAHTGVSDYRFGARVDIAI